ncbi:ABC transporter permease [Brachybacterium paraconglomeratum]|uniref:ABC transporter permease n=1 Tax=Brachybacterium paraconglomeratum TaxID=173362 RepID=UPI0021A80DFF|nr:ABC-2 family transporter protein [Brachybacterium paraconglomeratum]MCT1910003.1 ABC-2 family transporter protein [Brachybacterium paraconglomeratum]
MVATLYGSRLRSQATFRTSFLADVLGQVLIVGTEFLELWVILSQVGVLGGMTLSQVAVVYGLGALAFGIGDMFFGEIDGLSAQIRSGRLETLLIRPVPLLLQLSSLDLSLRRIGRIAVGLGMYVTALAIAGFSPTPALLLLAVLAPFAGALIFGALFTMAGALQFWLVDGREFANAFTYGGNYVATTPGAVFALPMRAFFTFVIPATLIAYAPALALLGLPGPALVPSWAGWIGLPVAVLAWTIALVLWRAGVRRYTGAGG